jgi:chromosome segregation ATPase
MENLFASFSHPDSIAFLLSVLVSFLIGFVTAWILWGSMASRYKKEAARWKKSFDDLTLEMNSLREQLDLKEADLVKAQREADEAREHYRLVLTDKAKWQADLDSSLEETVKLQASIHSHEATIDDLNSQILGLKARNAQLSKEAEKEGTALDQVVQMQSSYNATLSRLGSLEEKIARLADENAALRTATNQEDERLVAMKVSNEESTQRLAALEAKMSTLMEENDSLKAEIAGLSEARFNPYSAADVVNSTADEEEPDFLLLNPEKEVISETIILSASNQGDLKIVEGIGPKIEKLLKDAGIPDLPALAATTEARLREILLETGGERYRIHDPSTWPEQARLAANGAWDALKEYQDYLSGGREPGK